MTKAKSFFLIGLTIASLIAMPLFNIANIALVGGVVLPPVGALVVGSGAVAASTYAALIAASGGLAAIGLGIIGL